VYEALVDVCDFVLLQSHAFVIATRMLNDVGNLALSDYKEVAVERNIPNFLPGTTVYPNKRKIQALRSWLVINRRSGRRREAFERGKSLPVGSR
jgi:hypothetical protein